MMAKWSPARWAKSAIEVIPDILSHAFEPGDRREGKPMDGSFRSEPPGAGGFLHNEDNIG